MSVRDDGKGWLVDVRPNGREGRRIRKRFSTKAEAAQFERWIYATQNNKEWLAKPRDSRSLTELIDIWWKYKGKFQRNGKGMYFKLQNVDKWMKYPIAAKITERMFADYRVFRIEQGRCATTINHDQEYLSSLFSSLIKLGHYSGENPLIGFGMLPVMRTEMGFLHLNEVAVLLKSLSGGDLLAVKLCLATGARWSESASMTLERVVHNRVTFTKTKNGKNRTVPISPELAKEITEKRARPLLFQTNYRNVRDTIKELFPHLPGGQATHVLRHTFASHFMMNGGNILALKNILGHSKIEQTMVYAHFAPTYLNDAVKFNPLAVMDGQKPG